MLVLFYEDLKKDMKVEVKKVAKFYGKDLKDDVIDAIVEQCTFKSMKENPMTNLEDVPVFDKNEARFFRKGEVGDWENYFDDAKNAYIDQLSLERLEGSGLSVIYKL